MLAGMSAVEAAGAAPPLPTRPPAICFVDLSGDTALTEQIGDQAAAERVGRLGTLLQELAHSRGGSVVRLLGDGAMLQFPDPAGRRRNWPYDTRPQTLCRRSRASSALSSLPTRIAMLEK